MGTSTRRSSSTVEDEAIGSTGEAEQHPIAEAGQEAGQTASHLTRRAADVGFQGADRVREQAADGIAKLATSVRRVSGDLEGQQPQIADLATTAADGAERVANFLRETDARELVRNVEDVARRQPLLFVGGAFLLGAAAARFIKAAGGSSSSRHAMSTGGMDYGRRSYGTTYGGTSGTTYGTGSTGAGDIGAYEASGPGGTASGSMRTDPTDEGPRP